MRTSTALSVASAALAAPSFFKSYVDARTADYPLTALSAPSVATDFTQDASLIPDYVTIDPTPTINSYPSDSRTAAYSYTTDHGAAPVSPTSTAFQRWDDAKSLLEDAPLEVASRTDHSPSPSSVWSSDGFYDAVEAQNPPVNPASSVASGIQTPTADGTNALSVVYTGPRSLSLYTSPDQHLAQRRANLATSCSWTDRPVDESVSPSQAPNSTAASALAQTGQSLWNSLASQAGRAKSLAGQTTSQWAKPGTEKAKELGREALTNARSALSRWNNKNTNTGQTATPTPNYPGDYAWDSAPVRMALDLNHHREAAGFPPFPLDESGRATVPPYEYEPVNWDEITKEALDAREEQRAREDSAFNNWRVASDMLYKHDGKKIDESLMREEPVKWADRLRETGGILQSYANNRIASIRNREALSYAERTTALGSKIKSVLPDWRSKLGLGPTASAHDGETMAGKTNELGGTATVVQRSTGRWDKYKPWADRLTTAKQGLGSIARDLTGRMGTQDLSSKSPDIGKAKSWLTSAPGRVLSFFGQAQTPAAETNDQTDKRTAEDWIKRKLGGFASFFSHAQTTAPETIDRTGGLGMASKWFKSIAGRIRSFVDESRRGGTQTADSAGARLDLVSTG